MIEREIVRSIVTKGVASSTASFLSNQTDVDMKQERLNELLIEINSAIEFAKTHEPILNSSLREWLDDLQKASKEGEQVRSAFRDQSEDSRSIIPWKVAVKLYKWSMRVNRLNAVVTRLERKASNCEKFRQMLRDEINEQRDQTYTERVEKLERKVARLRNSLRTIKSNGLFMKRKKTKHAHGLGTTDDGLNIPISKPQFRYQNQDDPEKNEDPTSKQEHQRPPKFDEWEEKFTSHYSINDFAQCKMKGKTAAPDDDPWPIPPPPPPVPPVRTPGRNAYSNETSFLSQLFACISLKTRN